ncbi:MAG: NAD(P)H-quinone oxidoreductase [Armatimonadota bacterium]|nr:NAD(P)H-quinone oxidoreductase [Armatimonadota bacterium]
MMQTQMTLPETMKQIVVTTPGGPDVLALQDGPLPQPGPGEVLIRVAAVGINRADLMQRQDKYPPPPGASAILGLEVSGTIAACGPDAGTWHTGDAVCALVTGGGYAEYCLAPAPQCLPAPPGLSLTEAAALPEACFTVWANVFQRGRLTAGETLLVHGGSSGIGTTAIQLAKALGARVLTTAGSEAKCEACRRLGADAAINYRTEDFGALVKELTGGYGADVILDMVGGDYFQRNVDCLAVEGRLVFIASPQGSAVEFDFRPVMTKRLTITGSTLRPLTVAQKGAIARELQEHVWPLLASGQIKPVIDSAFPLADATAAHRRMESGAHIGKIVLTV